MPSTNLRKSTVRLCIASVFMAINIALSSFGIPVPGGHVYLNDVIIFIAAMTLDPFSAFLVGGVGSFLGDFFFYPTPMFVSLVTHGLQAVAVSLISNFVLKKKPLLSSIIAVIIGGIIMVTGYTLGRAYIYGTPIDATLKLPFQIAQATLGGVASIIICYPLKFKKFVNKYTK